MGKVRAASLHFTAGGGPFALESLTVGVFRDDQPGHHISVGSDRRSHRPLERDQGWIMPAGAEGLCHFDAPLEMQSVTIDSGLLREVGLEDPGTIAPVIGVLDPIVLQMTLGALEFETGGALYRETMQRALAAHLAQTLAPAPAEAVGIEDARLRRVLAHIRERLGEDLSLEDLAAIAGMSPYHFARSFKSAFGASPLQYVIGLRIEEAQVLLRTTRLPVAEIAWRVGYQDTSRFGRHFKARVGATPKSFRDG